MKIKTKNKSFQLAKNMDDDNNEKREICNNYETPVTEKHNSVSNLGGIRVCLSDKLVELDGFGPNDIAV